MTFFKPGGIVPMKTLDEWFPSGFGDGRKFILRDTTISQGMTDIFFRPLAKAKDFWSNTIRWYGIWSDEHLESFSDDELQLLKFVEWHPPKTRNKIMMYRPIIKVTPTPLYHGFKAADPFYAITNNWTSSKSTATGGTNQVVGFQEMEVEVDE